MRAMAEWSGAKEEQENRRRQAEHHHQQSTKPCTTFFFSNFPENHGEFEMFRLFQKWARVKEVFISKRLNKWGRRFGFIRFFEVGNVPSLERELDNCFIGNMKLHVNVPRYRRERFVNTGNAPCLEEKSRSGGFPSRNYQRKNKEVWMVKRGKEVIRSGVGKDANGYVLCKQTYADIVRSPLRAHWKGPSFTTKANILPWMKNNMVGRMKAEWEHETLQEECIKGGMSMIIIRFLGDNLVLLTSKSIEKIEDIVKSSKEWFDFFFEDIKPWSESLVVSYKRVWVKCYGFPIHLWNKECF